MNEQFKQLMQQAGTDTSGKWMGVDHAEKFAELIVKETMQVVANQLPSNQYLDVAHAVIEHFKDADVT
jgi:hypothetical protein